MAIGKRYEVICKPLQRDEVHHMRIYLHLGTRNMIYEPVVLCGAFFIDHELNSKVNVKCMAMSGRS